MPSAPASLPGRRAGLAVLLGLGLALAGCVLPPQAAGVDPRATPALPLSPDPLTRSSEQAGDELAAAWRQAGLGRGETLLVSSLVALDDLRTSSPLGRLVAEQVAGRLAQHGLGVKELRLREGLVIRADQGELMLSRDAAELARQHLAQVVLIGTYTRSREATRINLRLVRLDDARVLAASQYAVAVDERTETLRRVPDGPAATPAGRGTLYDAIRDYDRRQPPLR